MDDFPKAALKHLEDARVLKDEQRFDGAAYLAGYVVECTLKTVIEAENPPVPHIHDLNSLRQSVDQLALLAKHQTGPLYIAATQSLVQILAWKPEMRYSSPHVTQSVATTWVSEAETLYTRIIGSLTLAGTI